MNEWEMNGHPALDVLIDAPASEAERSRVLDHVAECAHCEEALATALQLREMARALPRERLPERDLWAGISARIDPRPAARPVATGPGRRMAPWLPRTAAAAAGVAALLAAGALGYLLRGGEGGSPVAVAVPAATAEAPAALASFASTEADYRSTVEMLEAELHERRATLSPRTIATVEENLAIIDRAIEEARVALARDPSSADLPLLLANVYRQKVEVLSDVLALSARS